VATKGDVELIIRARNEATKTLDNVARALTSLTKNQDELSSSSTKASDALGDIAKLAGTVAAAYSKLNSDADRAAASLQRQEASLAENRASYQALTAQMEAAARVQARLRAEAEKEGADKKALNAQLKLVEKAYQDLSTQASKTATQIDRQDKSVKESFYALQEITGSAQAASAALAKVQAAHQQAGAAAAADAAKQAQAAAALEQTAQAAGRRAALELKKSMSDAASGAQVGWREAQDGVRQLAAEMARSGTQSAEQAASMQRLQAVARDNKKAYNELQVAIQQYSRALREQGATQQQIAAAQARAKASLAEYAAIEAAHQKASNAAANNAARQAQAAEQEQAAVAASRRSALELKKAMTDAATGAQASWRDAQEGIRQLAAEMARTGTQTTDQIADMAKLQATARASKTAYNELQVAVEQYNRVLRDQGASQQQVAAAQDRARAAMAGALNMTVASAGAAQRAASGARELGQAHAKAATDTNKLDRSLESLFANSRRSLSMYQRWRGEILSLTSSYLGLYGAIQGVVSIVEASMTMQGVESRLNVVTGGDQAKTAAEMQWVRSEADRLGFSLNTLASEWSKFAVSAQASNFTMEQSRKIFTSVSEAGRVLKLNSQQVERAFVAITQMMSKGTIQMEELRQQLGEHIPGAFALMAEAAGVSGAELTKMMEGGQLTSDYLLKFADVLDKRFGGQLSASLQMLQAELGRFQSAWTLALNKIGEAGVIEAVTEALRELQELLRSPDAQVWFERLGAGIAGVIKFLMAILNNLDLIMTAFAALGAAKGVAYVLALRTAIVSTMATITAATTATKGLSVAMAGLGGPIGIAIGLLAGAFAFLATRVSATEKSMHSAVDAVDKITLAYRNGAKSAKEWADSLNGLSQLQLERDLRNLKDKLKDELEDIVQPFGRGFMTRARNSNSPLAAVFEEIQQLVAKARDGSMPLSEFKSRLDEIAKTHPQFKELALKLQDSTAEAAKTEDALLKLEASIRLMRGEATDADKKLLGLATAIKETDDAANGGAAAMDKYTEAMGRLAKRIPDLKKELEFQEATKAIQADLQAAFDAAGNDEGLKQAALDRANAAMAAVRDGYDEALIKEFSQKRGDAMQQSVGLLRQFEGFSPKPYWDTNAYRVGYGSDTVTLDDGTIRKVTQGMAVTQKDALRDLVRRIGEFQETVKTQIGSDRWSAFSPQQQAALTSIAYNYGSLPDRILRAVRGGTSEEIAAAVRGLKGDNAGINSGRRETEAAILENPNFALAANTAKQVQAKVEKIDKVVTDLNKQIDAANLTDREKYIREALERAGIDTVVKAVKGMLEEGNIDLTKRPQVKNEDGSISTVRSISVEVDGKVALIPTVSDDGRIMSDDEAVGQFQKTGKHLGMFDSEAAAAQFAEALHEQQSKFYSEDAARVAKLAADAFDTAADEKARPKIAEMQAQLAAGTAAMSREEFIANEARREGVNLLTEQGRKYAELKGQMFDREQAEKRVNDLMALRKELQEQLTFAQEQGNFEAIPGIQLELESVNNRLREAIDLAIGFWEAMGGPNADLAILKLQNLKSSVGETGKVVLDAKAINQQFASGATSAFMKAGDALGGLIDGTLDGKEAMGAIKDAFLGFAADFLRQIAQMILQQVIFNMVSGMMGGGGKGGAGGLGGAIAGIFHDGGVVGAGGAARLASPSWFTNAVRYHEGGIAGLRPNEVPAVLERGEEVLTANDPRHVNNGGGTQSNVNLKMVNAIDSASVLDAAMNTREGEQVFMNYIRANRSSIKSALG